MTSAPACDMLGQTRAGKIAWDSIDIRSRRRAGMHPATREEVSPENERGSWDHPIMGTSLWA